jgi:hypothetical protein
LQSRWQPLGSCIGLSLPAPLMGLERVATYPIQD